jgi:protocatechuate 3,4-dioxygenase beta subunit
MKTKDEKNSNRYNNAIPEIAEFHPGPSALTSIRALLRLAEPTADAGRKAERSVAQQRSSINLPEATHSFANVAGYRRPVPGTQPAHLHPPYRSCVKRAPRQPLVYLPHTLSEISGPLLGKEVVNPKAFDLTKQGHGEPLGERIVVSGRVMDEDGRAVANTLVEIWQANAAGRYRHKVDQHDAPLDPNFAGVGHTLTDAEGRYQFLTIRPGAYPWRNHDNAWRPAHIHFSLFGPAFATRLVTQMYFPGDSLIPFDPIFNCTADEKARNCLISVFDWATTKPEHCLGYRFDIILAGREATPMENKK